MTLLKMPLASVCTSCALAQYEEGVKALSKVVQKAMLWTLQHRKIKGSLPHLLLLEQVNQERDAVVLRQFVEAARQSGISGHETVGGEMKESRVW